MNPWTNNLPPFKGRKHPPLGHDAAVNLAGSDYSGPADGDFARYVDQLLSNAETQRRVQTRAPAPVHDARIAARSPAAPAGGARHNPAQTATHSAADSLARLRSQAQDVTSKPALMLGLKLVPLLIWLPVVVALFFWPGAATWLVGLALIAGLVFNAVRRALGRKKT